MACNILNLGRGAVIAHAGSSPAIERMCSLGLRVLETDISEFAADCGGIHCLVQELTRAAAC